MFLAVVNRVRGSESVVHNRRPMLVDNAKVEQKAGQQLCRAIFMYSFCNKKAVHSSFVIETTSI